MITSTAELWSEMDITDLGRFAEVGIPIEEIADILLREVEEVRQKATELKSNLVRAFDPPLDSYSVGAALCGRPTRCLARQPVASSLPPQAGRV